jgi:nucleotidyltransferase substrate binding protein (TIGR01987 family)
VRCLQTLEQAYQALNEQSPESILYDVYRAACVKEFEIILEQSGKLLKKRLREYFSSNQQADRLNFKDIFRYAAKYSLISLEESERWLIYRDNRNNTAHDYGVKFADEILASLPQFLIDATHIHDIIRG